MKKMTFELEWSVYFMLLKSETNIIQQYTNKKTHHDLYATLGIQ